MLFIGIDLAWSRRNRSGGAVIRDHHLIAYTGDLGDDDDIVAFVTRHLQQGEGAVLAVDAPLRVPNATGARACDRALSADWRLYDAGALPANRRLLAYHPALGERGETNGGEYNLTGENGEIRGETLVVRFAQCGFGETAPLPQQGPGRYICEIFPHPAHVYFFNLAKTLKYKAKPRRTTALRHAEYARYQRYLATLTTATPPLQGTSQLLATDVATLRGYSLKVYEDTLDAVTCAYTGLYLWHHGPAKTRVYGTIATGHILTPPLPHD